MHGPAAEAAECLGAGDCSQAELHAVISNALRRIACIEAVQQADAGDERGEYVVTPAKPKIDKVCETCHGEVSFEGWIEWNIERQAFEVLDICDKGHHCKTCDGQTYAIDIEYKPLVFQIEVDGKEQTYRFHTQAELSAFHDGLRKGAKIEQWEVAYSDEESE